VLQVQHVGVERDHDVLDEQADAVQHEEDGALARDAGALAVPEGPVPVANVGEGGGDDRGDGRRGDRPDAVRVQHGVAHVGDGQADDADNPELGEFMNDLPEPHVQPTYHSHRAINPLVLSPGSPS
jgi:hypothetical protein